MLFDIQGGVTLPLNVIITTVLCVAAFFVFALGMALRTMRKKVVTGIESLIGEVGTAKEDLNPEGFITVEENYGGPEQKVRLKGEKVIVSQKEGQTLIVKKEE